MSTIAETPLRGRARHRMRIDGWRWGGRIFLVFMLLYTALPMIWMLITSIKSGFAAMQFPPQWWPDQPTLASYEKLLDPQNSVGHDFLRFFWNSLFVSTATTVLSVVVAVPAAYAFSRFTFPHLRNVSTVTILLLAVANFNSFIIPWIMTGGGPAGSSDIWITHIYQLAFGRQRGGVASAYAVILFIVMMVLGYFYVRALTKGERKDPA